jgi:hypothetical protein
MYRRVWRVDDGYEMRRAREILFVLGFMPRMPSTYHHVLKYGIWDDTDYSCKHHVQGFRIVSFTELYARLACISLSGLEKYHMTTDRVQPKRKEGAAMEEVHVNSNSRPEHNNILRSISNKFSYHMIYISML